MVLFRYHRGVPYKTDTREAESEIARAQPAAIPWEDKALCEACQVCTARVGCRRKVLIRPDTEEKPFVDAIRCYGCEAWLMACPYGAIRKALSCNLQTLGTILGGNSPENRDYIGEGIEEQWIMK